MRKATLPVPPEGRQAMLLAGLSSASCTQVRTEVSYGKRGRTVQAIVISSIHSLFFLSFSPFPFRFVFLLLICHLSLVL
jgi:hypothetical protein